MTIHFLKTIPFWLLVLITVSSAATATESERIALDSKGFSIMAPSGWSVEKNLPRASLFMQAQVAAPEYPRNIAVLRFNQPKVINDVTAADFSDYLVKSFPAASPTIENYALRNHESITMTDGREGILIYTDFTDNGRKMMQAHVLVSSQTNHYLVTYTDLAEHFENSKDGSQPYLTEAWGAMTSIQLDSPNPSVSNDLSIGVILGVTVLVGAISAALVYHKRRQARALYRGFSK